jgi:hypothetical protein
MVPSLIATHHYFAGKIGVYSEITLKMARDKRDEARRVQSEGIDPGQLRKVAREECRNEGKDLFPLAWSVPGVRNRRADAATDPASGRRVRGD